jgi:hypothetical protein
VIRALPVLSLVLLCGCSTLDELIFGPSPQQQTPPDSTAAPDGDVVTADPGRRPVGPPPGESLLIRLLREATRSIPWSGPAITLAVWLSARMRRRSNQLRAIVQGVDYAVHNGDLNKSTLYLAIENAARALTGLAGFRKLVASIKADNRTKASGS